MRLLFLTIGKKKTPSSRFRVRQYIPLLEADGIQCDVKHIPHAFFQRFKLLRGIKDYDAVIIQKKLFSPLELWLLKSANPNIIYDFDDLVTTEHPMHKVTDSVQKKLNKNEKRFKAVLKTVRGVIAGNEFLKEKAAEFNDNVKIIPTPVDVDKFPVKNVNFMDEEEIVIGWIGTKSNLFYLDHLGIVWRELREKYPKVVLKVVSNQPYDNDTIRIKNREWKEETEIDDILSFDIGIMPLTNDDWSKGKCGFKLLQYMAAGLPTVSSNIGANNEIVSHGENGFLAGGEEDWLKYLSALMENSELRRILGVNARATVEAKYSLQICKDMLVNAIKGFIRDGKE